MAACKEPVTTVVEETDGQPKRQMNSEGDRETPKETDRWIGCRGKV